MYWLEVVFGLALMVAPYGLGYRDNSAALWASLVIGAVVVLASGYRAYVQSKERWEAWVDVVAGVAAILVPFLLGFGALAAAVWSFVAIGVLIVAASGYELYSTRGASA